MTSLPFPICVVCARPVERMTTISQGFADQVLVIVECHGAAEQMTITPDDLHDGRGRPAQIEPGRAFVPPGAGGVLSSERAVKSVD